MIVTPALTVAVALGATDGAALADAVGLGDALAACVGDADGLAEAELAGDAAGELVAGGCDADAVTLGATTGVVCTGPPHAASVAKAASIMLAKKIAPFFTGLTLSYGVDRRNQNANS